MATPPLTYLEKKWAGGYGSGNSLFQAATQTSDRGNVPTLDYDVYRNISTVGRRTLMTLGRFLYENCSPIGGSVDEIARLSASNYIPQFEGANKAFGDMAEQRLEDEDWFIDIRGWPFTMATLRRNLIKSILREGEMGILLTEVDGAPKLQVIPSHRIGSRFSSGNFTTIINDTTSAFDGAKLIDGVILDDYGKALGYRVFDERGINYTEVSANDMILVFIPNYPEQVRGFSQIGKVAWEAFDVKESRDFELIAQKLRATFPVTVHNETGYADPTKAIFGPKPIANDSSTNAAASLPTKVTAPGEITYLKAGTGQKIEFPENNNPGANVMEFQRDILRSFFHGIGWSFDMYDPTRAGGAQMRVVIEKINAACAELQDFGLEPPMRRITGWRVAKHIKAGRLPDDPEWFRWGFQGPAQLTADRKYESEIDLEENSRGWLTDAKACGKRGTNPARVRAKKESETAEKWASAQRIADQFKITIQEAYASMYEDNPNGIAAKPSNSQDGESSKPEPA